MGKMIITNHASYNGGTFSIGITMENVGAYEKALTMQCIENDLLIGFK